MANVLICVDYGCELDPLKLYITILHKIRANLNSLYVISGLWHTICLNPNLGYTILNAGKGMPRANFIIWVKLPFRIVYIKVKKERKTHAKY